MNIMMKFGIAAAVLLGAGQAQAQSYGVTLDTSANTGGIYDRAGAGCTYGNGSTPNGGCTHYGLGSSSISTVGGTGNIDATGLTATTAASGAGAGVTTQTTIDLATASLHLYASDSNITGNCSTPLACGGTGIYATYSDTLHFTIAGANDQTITPISLLFTLEGSMIYNGLAIDNGPSAELFGTMGFGHSDARFDLQSNYNTGYSTIAGFDTYPSAAPGIWTTNADHTVNTYAETYFLTGATLDVPVYLRANLSCNIGYTCDYGNTARLGLTLPSGASFTSASGVFLTGGATTAPGAVPEPATWAMMLVGFGLAGGILRRRRDLLAA